MLRGLRRGILTIIVIGIASISYCQKADTLSLVSDLNKVMSFAVKPYLYYRTVIKNESIPVLQTTDTLTLHGLFYKNTTDIYYGTEHDEMYLIDSLLYRVNHPRKSVWISKVNVNSKENLDVLPLSKSLNKEALIKNYTIKRTVVDKNTLRFDLSPKRKSNTETFIVLEYDPKTDLPKLLQVEIRAKEPVDDEAITSLQSDSINVSSLIKEIDNKKFMVRTQRISVRFLEISNSKEKASQMPVFKEYASYEVIKTFDEDK